MFFYIANVRFFMDYVKVVSFEQENAYEPYCQRRI